MDFVFASDHVFISGTGMPWWALLFVVFPVAIGGFGVWVLRNSKRTWFGIAWLSFALTFLSAVPVLLQIYTGLSVKIDAAARSVHIRDDSSGETGFVAEFDDFPAYGKRVIVETDDEGRRSTTYVLDLMHRSGAAVELAELSSEAEFQEKQKRLSEVLDRPLVESPAELRRLGARSSAADITPQDVCAAQYATVRANLQNDGSCVLTWKNAFPAMLLPGLLLCITGFLFLIDRVHEHGWSWWALFPFGIVGLLFFSIAYAGVRDASASSSLVFSDAEFRAYTESSVFGRTLESSLPVAEVIVVSARISDTASEMALMDRELRAPASIGAVFSALSIDYVLVYTNGMSAADVLRIADFAERRLPPRDW